MLTLWGRRETGTSDKSAAMFVALGPFATISAHPVLWSCKERQWGGLPIDNARKLREQAKAAFAQAAFTPGMQQKEVVITLAKASRRLAEDLGESLGSTQPSRRGRDDKEKWSSCRSA
jgi:hypothetical protein